MKKKNNKFKKSIFSFKKPLFIITTIIMAFIAVIFIIWVVAKCTIKPNETYANSTNSTSIKSGTIYIKSESNDVIELQKKDSDGNYTNEYKVSVIGDLHLANNDKKSHKYLPLDCLEAYIKIEKPDLVILNGDTLCVHTDVESTPKDLIDIFERNNQYWSFTLGNHDGEFWEIKKDIGKEQSRLLAFKTLSGYDETTKQYAPHCLARIPSDTSHGLNNVIHLCDGDGNKIKSLLLTDCNHVDNTTWYSNIIGSCANDSVLINHIPFKSYLYAYNNIGKDNEVKYNYGSIREEICTDRDDTPLWNAILNQTLTNNKIKNIIFSHDHKNNLSLTYKNINMLYSCGFAFNSYTRRVKTSEVFRQFAYMIDSDICEYVEGGTNLYIKNNNEIIIGNKYAQFNGTFDHLKNKLYLASYGAITYNGRGLTIFNRIIYPLATAGCFTYYGFLINYHVNDKKKKAKTK